MANRNYETDRSDKTATIASPAGTPEFTRREMIDDKIDELQVAYEKLKTERQFQAKGDFGFVVSCELKLFGPRNKFVHHAWFVSKENDSCSEGIKEQRNRRKSENIHEVYIFFQAAQSSHFQGSSQKIRKMYLSKVQSSTA